MDQVSPHIREMVNFQFKSWLIIKSKKCPSQKRDKEKSVINSTLQTSWSSSGTRSSLDNTRNMWSTSSMRRTKTRNPKRSSRRAKIKRNQIRQSIWKRAMQMRVIELMLSRLIKKSKRIPIRRPKRCQWTSSWRWSDPCSKSWFMVCPTIDLWS